jgi:transglutaminase-like putative cysteine protease
MRISVLHSTRYRYDSPVHLEPHVFRLRPRENATQRLLQYALAISPAPAGRSDCLDQDGNCTVEVWFDAPVSELWVQSSFQLDTLRQNPFDFLPVREQLPLDYREPLGSALAPYLTPDSSGAVYEFAAKVRAAAGSQALSFLGALNGEIFSRHRQVIRDEGAPNAAELTLREGEGSCRDLAVLFAAACRAVGIAARFVSGYECDAALDRHPHMHAWAEAYIEGGGWRGFDPSRGLAVGTRHVAVAAAAHPALAAPTVGSFRGAAQAKMEASIAMQVAE